MAVTTFKITLDTGGTKADKELTFNLNCTGAELTATTDQTWVHVALNGNKIVITADPNTGTDGRDAVVYPKVGTSSCSSKYAINVHQNGSGGGGDCSDFAVTCDDCPSGGIPAEGGTYTFSHGDVPDPPTPPTPTTDAEEWLHLVVCEEETPCSETVNNPITITVKVKNTLGYDMLHNGRFHVTLNETYIIEGKVINYSFDANARHAWCDRGSARFTYCDETNLIFAKNDTIQWTCQIDGTYAGKTINSTEKPRLYINVTDLNGDDRYIHAMSYPDIGVRLKFASDNASQTISNNGVYSFELEGGAENYNYGDDNPQVYHKGEVTGDKAGYIKHTHSGGTVRMAPRSIGYWNDNYTG